MDSRFAAGTSPANTPNARENNDTMDESLKEAVGFLSRWWLLALAVAGGVLVAWASLAAAAAAPRRAPAPIISDEIVVAPVSQRHVVAHLSDSVPIVLYTQFLFLPPGATPRIVYGSSRKMYILLEGLPPGLHRVHLRGIPYGTFAFEEMQGLCKVVAPGAEVLLFDARLSETPEGARELPRTLREMRGSLEVVLIHPGPLEAYRRLHREIRLRDGDVPYVFSAHEPQDNMWTLNYVASSLNRLWADRPPLVTADAELASRASAQGFPTHWIHPQPDERIERGGVRRYESLGDFRGWLRARRFPVTSPSASTRSVR